jgi:hypothetical protein
MLMLTIDPLGAFSAIQLIAFTVAAIDVDLLQPTLILAICLNINNSKVAAEFGGRASVIWDVNFAGKGEDCTGHGSMVSSAAAGKTYGVAIAASKAGELYVRMHGIRIYGPLSLNP